MNSSNGLDTRMDGNRVLMTEQVKQLCRERGMDVVGIADPRQVDAPPSLRPEDILPDSNSIIVFGKAVPHEAYVRENNGAYDKAAFRYFDLLDSMSAELAGLLRERGHLSTPIGSNRPVMFAGGKFRGVVSLKHAAEAAGIGSIGRNTLLLSRQFGPRLRLGGVLTRAPLVSDLPLKKPVCIKGCTLCIDACPHGALRGEGIDFYTCLTKAHGHPFMFLTGAIGSLSDRPALNKAGAWLYNTFGKKYAYLCWACITSCPLFRAGKSPR